MLFNSLSFLVFFPIVTILYFILPHRFRWVWLLGASYYFYMSWNPKYALLMAASTIITYLSGILIERANRQENVKKRDAQRKLWVALSFSLNLSILFFFKYFDFALDSLNHLLLFIGVRAVTPSYDVLLPVGISFYTFQALSYTMDVYRGELPAEKNLGKYALFVSFFPQLVAGPIERSKNLLTQVYERHYFDYDRVKNGLLLMIWGLFQKIAVADRVAVIVNEVYDHYSAYTGAHVALATLLFSVQIFCDFSGYSDIAKGAAQVMGFRLMDNFRQPYFSTSIHEYWRRWHISLSTWFRDYLYIPLGGSRCSRLKKYRNIMITFLVSGLWHGANWTYVAWGGLHGAYHVLGDMLKPVRRKVSALTKINAGVLPVRLLQGFFTFALVSFAYIFFRAPAVGSAFDIIKQIFVNFSLTKLLDSELLTVIGFNRFDVLFTVGAIVILFVVQMLQTKIDVLAALSKKRRWFRWAVYLSLIFGLLVYVIIYRSGASQEFIYFQF